MRVLAIDTALGACAAAGAVLLNRLAKPVPAKSDANFAANPRRVLSVEDKIPSSKRKRF